MLVKACNKKSSGPNRTRPLRRPRSRLGGSFPKRSKHPLICSRLGDLKRDRAPALAQPLRSQPRRIEILVAAVSPRPSISSGRARPDLLPLDGAPT